MAKRYPSGRGAHVAWKQLLSSQVLYDGQGEEVGAVQSSALDHKVNACYSIFNGHLLFLPIIYFLFHIS